MSPAGTNNHTSAMLLAALRFAANKHSRQRRKDGRTPYINHPIAVAEILARIGWVTDPVTLQAALLHDTLEDTETTAQELDEHFGEDVRRLVEELTDNKSLPKLERKKLQIEHAPGLSVQAKQIKIADLLCNAGDLAAEQPVGWDLQRKHEYLNWAGKVVDGCRSSNAHLERAFDAVMEKKKALLGA